MKLIVGLGNPGDDYTNTRHNIGFYVLDNFCQNEKWSKKKYGEYIKSKINNQDVIMVKPSTFMNLSGQAVKYFADFYRIDLKDILIIQDDLDLPTGKLRIKYDSSDGGHNGIKSIIECLQSKCFLRMKIGISQPANWDIINYVLHKFSKYEVKSLTDNLSIYFSAINDFIQDATINNLMNKYN